MSNHPKRRKASPYLHRLHPTKGWRGSEYSGRRVPLPPKRALAAIRKAAAKTNRNNSIRYVGV